MRNLDQNPQLNSVNFSLGAQTRTNEHSTGVGYAQEQFARKRKNRVLAVVTSIAVAGGLGGSYWLGNRNSDGPQPSMSPEGAIATSETTPAPEAFAPLPDKSLGIQRAVTETSYQTAELGDLRESYNEKPSPALLSDQQFEIIAAQLPDAGQSRIDSPDDTAALTGITSLLTTPLSVSTVRQYYLEYGEDMPELAERERQAVFYGTDPANELDHLVSAENPNRIGGELGSYIKQGERGLEVSLIPQASEVQVIEKTDSSLVVRFNANLTASLLAVTYDTSTVSSGAYTAPQERRIEVSCKKLDQNELKDPLFQSVSAGYKVCQVNLTPSPEPQP